MEEFISECVGFEWDTGNHIKNLEKHGVSWQECEQIFFNTPVLIFEDAKHSETENRSYVLGQTDDERLLFIAFTVRKHLIRVISARDMSKKERGLYEQAKENTEI